MNWNELFLIIPLFIALGGLWFGIWIITKDDKERFGPK